MDVVQSAQMTVLSTLPSPGVPESTDELATPGGLIAGSGGQSRLSTLVAGLGVFVAFIPAINGQYGFSDDYTLLYLAKSQPSELASIMLDAGRVLTVPLYQLLFSSADVIDGLGLVRVISATARHLVRTRPLEAA